MENQGWRRRGLCTGLGAEETDSIFFIKPGQSANRARLFCSGCPVKKQCLNYALLYSERGIWAGTTDEERDRMDPWIAEQLKETAIIDGTLEERDVNKFLPTKHSALGFDPELEALLKWAEELEEAHDLLYSEPIFPEAYEA